MIGSSVLVEPVKLPSELPDPEWMKLGSSWTPACAPTEVRSVAAMPAR